MEEESWRRNLGRVIMEASGRHLEASGRHLAGVWEASGETRETPGGSLWLEGSRRVLEAKSNTPLSLNATSSRTCQFYDVFLRVGITKYRKLQ